MAITFRSQITANKFLPSANPINITVNSNNTGKCNFRYVCDVYINDINVFRFKLFPDPSTGYAFFQLADVINDYLKEFMPVISASAGVALATDTGANPNKSMAKVFCKFGEEYDSSLTCDGDVVIYPNLATSNTFYVFYGAVDYKDWPFFNSTDWANYVTNHLTGNLKFLTNRNRNSIECSYNDNYYLDYLNSLGPTSDVKLKIAVKGNVYSSGTTTVDPTYTISIGGFPTYKRMRISCGPMNINRLYNNDIINASTQYYDVWLENVTTSTIISEVIRIKVSKPKTYRTRLGFIGLLGSPEYITFFHRDRARLDIERKNFKNYLTSRNGNNWTYAVGDREIETYATNASEKHNVTTFVTKEQSQWLYEMWLSTNVWVEDRPSIYPFQLFRESSSPTSRMLIRLPEDHLVTDTDQIFLIADNQPNFSIYNGKFAVDSVEGRNIYLTGFTYNNYNVEDACGWVVLNESTRTLPIVTDDNSIEIKQKEGGLIQYSLQYTNSVDKITLRG